MLTLLIMRHGKSKWNQEGLADHDRSLAKRGRKESRQVGQALALRELVPDIILSSTAKRARTTVKHLLKGSGFETEVSWHAGLYAGELSSHFGALNALPDGVQVALIVGHNPLLEELLELLTGRFVRLPTATLACVELPITSWSQLDHDTSGELRFVLRGKKAGERAP
ncbi:MAG: histidine phosphatase family protein [Anaerolineae bacterium]|nr:histidine phosphatase family protein [Anaerolineae bacterium]